MLINKGDLCIIIPARLGSKGLPFKNRTLFEHTANIIPDNYKCVTYVTTDDPEVKKMALSHEFEVIDRPSELAQDKTSTRDTLIHAIDNIKCTPSTLVVLLYLTYPERIWQDVEDAYAFFKKYYDNWATSSLLCRKELKISPYLCLKESGPNGIFGKQLESHDLYRRQDYPNCFEISHYISMFTAGSIYKLNNNLYCENTVFYQIDDPIDVDTKSDLDKLNGKANSSSN